MNEDEKKPAAEEKPLRWSPPTRPQPRARRETPLQVYTPDERAAYVPPATDVKPVTRRFIADPAKLKVRRERRERREAHGFATGLGAYSKPGKTARDRAKPPSGHKTNDPSISQKMKGQKGSK